MTIEYLYIAIGSALGGMMRYWCMINASNYFGNNFPYGTLIVNILGSFIIGCLAGLIFAGKRSISDNMQKFMMVGICGGYTTFSSFSLDTLKLLQKAEYLKAASNITMSVILCLLASYIGYIIVNIMTYNKHL